MTRDMGGSAQGFETRGRLGPVTLLISFTVLGHRPMAPITGAGLDTVIPRSTGAIGHGLTLEEGQAAARLCALNTLAVAGAACGGDFSRLRLLSLSGFIRCVPEFGQQAKVMDGASEVFLQALGDNGKQVRTAVGVYALPGQAPVEIFTIFEMVNDND